MVSVVCVIGNQYACIYSDISCAPAYYHRGLPCGWVYGYHGCIAFVSAQRAKTGNFKDSHIGAFSVIKLAEFGLIYVAALSQIVDYRALEVFCCGFFLSRCLSGLSVVSFRSAKTDGMLYHLRVPHMSAG